MPIRYRFNGINYNIPENEAGQFEKDVPGAQRVASVSPAPKVTKSNWSQPSNPTAPIAQQQSIPQAPRVKPVNNPYIARPTDVASKYVKPIAQNNPLANYQQKPADLSPRTNNNPAPKALQQQTDVTTPLYNQNHPEFNANEEAATGGTTPSATEVNQMDLDKNAQDAQNKFDKDKLQMQLDQIGDKAESQDNALTRQEMEKQKAWDSDHPFLAALRDAAKALHPEANTPYDEINNIRYTNPDINNLRAVNNKVSVDKTIVDEAQRKGHTTVAANLLRGAANALTSPYSWKEGETSEALDTEATLTAAQKKAQGLPTTSTEDQLLDAAAVDTAVHDNYDKDIGRAYKAGQVTGQSVPFMADFLLNPASRLGEAASEAFAKYGIEKFGKEAMKSTLGKIARGAVRGAADFAGGNIMAATSGAARIAADASTRQLGQVNTGVDQNGYTTYKGTQGGDGTAKSLVKSYGNELINDWSEMFGEYFGPAINGASSLAGKTTRKIGLGKVNDLIGKIKASDWAKTVGDLEKTAKWNGALGEYGEEVVGNVMNAATVGDESWSDVTDPEQNLDTFLGVSLMGGFMSAVKTAGYRTPKYAAQQNLKEADRIGQKQLGSTWEEAKNTMDSSDDKELKEYISQTLLNKKVTPQQKQAVMNYAAKKQAWNGVNLADVKRKTEGDVDPHQLGMESQYDKGYTESDPTAQHTAKLSLDKAAQELDTAGKGVNGVDYLPHVPGDTPVQKIDWLKRSQYDPDYISKVLDYYNAKARYDGLINSVQDNIQDAVQQRSDEIDQNTHQDGNIYNATLKVDDEPVHILSGNIIMNTDGTVDKKNSGESIIVRRADGTMEMRSPDDLLSIDQVSDPDEVKQSEAQRITQEQAQQAADTIDGKQPFNPGDEVGILGADGTPASVKVASNDGTNVVIDDGHTQVATTPEELQQRVDAADQAQFDQQTKQNPYHLNDEYTLYTDKGPVHATVAEEKNADGLIDVMADTDNGLIPGKSDSLFTPEELDRLTKEPEQQVQEQPAEQPEQNPTIEQPEQQPVETSQEQQPESTSQTDVGKETVKEPAPVLDEEGEPVFHKMPIEQSASILSELDKEDQDLIVDNNINTLSKEVDKLSKTKPKSTSFNKIKAERATIKEQLAEAQTKLDYWNKLKRAINHTPAEISKDDLETRKEETAKAVEENKGKQALIKEKFDKAPKIEGSQDEIILANGEKMPGHYILTEADAVTPSHNPEAGYAKSEGFPIDENGKTVNDRDYEHDKQAQLQVEQKAQKYDGRAIQSPVIVSKDGIVLSGNDRTMAGQLAAKNGTDESYKEYARNYSSKYGFTPEQTDGFKNPRILFVPDETLPYNAETFSKFNAEDKKTQSKTEQAVKSGKVINGQTVSKAATILDGFDSLSGFYSNPQATKEMLHLLINDGVIGQNEVAEMMDGDSFSSIGKDFVENVLLGSVLDESGIRKVMQMKELRQVIVKSITELVQNNGLGDYSFKNEITDAINLLYDAKKYGIKTGQTVEDYMRQGSLFEKNVLDLYGATVQMLANALNKGQLFFKHTLSAYNKQAIESSNGQTDLFSGGIRTKDEIIRDVLKTLGYEQGTRATESTGQPEGESTGNETENATSGDEGSRTTGRSEESGSKESEGLKEEKPAPFESMAEEAERLAPKEEPKKTEEPKSESLIEEAERLSKEEKNPDKQNKEASVNKEQEIASEEKKVDPDPTDAQKEAGNYQKGHVKTKPFADYKNIQSSLNNKNSENDKVSESVPQGKFRKSPEIYKRSEESQDKLGRGNSETSQDASGLIRGRDESPEEIKSSIESQARKRGSERNLHTIDVDIKKDDSPAKESKALDYAKAKFMDGTIISGKIIDSTKNGITIESNGRSYTVSDDRILEKSDNPINVDDTDLMFRNGTSDEEQQIIENSKKDGTYLKAPNGKDTNLSLKQWIQVRTNAFKKWFGDWEKGPRLERLKQSSPIEITGKEITPSEDLKQYKKNAIEYGKSLRGDYTNKDTGESINIALGTNRGGIKEILNHDYKDKEHIQSIAAIPKIIENSIFIDEVPNEDVKKNPHISSYRYYVCGLKIGGEDYTVRAAIAVNKDGKRYYDHKLSKIEKGKLLILSGLSSMGESHPADKEISLSDIKDKRLSSILQINSSKIVDENGEPKIVYHSTDSKFNTFDLSKSRQNADIPSFFFSPNKEDWADMGDKTITAFLSIKNPVENPVANMNGRDVRDKLIKEGYDGSIGTEDGEIVEYGAFYPNQIKSATDNAGEFSNNDEDIRYRDEEKETPEDPEEITSEVKELASSLHTPVNILTDTDSLEGRKKQAKGWYDTKTGEVTVVLPNASSVQDAKMTVLHEIVGHDGLRSLLGDNFDHFISDVYSLVDKSTRENIVRLAEKNGFDFPLATEEYMAKLAEGGFEDKTAWSKIRRLFNNALSMAKIKLGFRINDNDLKYMLWRSYQLKKNLSPTIDEAENIDMKRRLKVGPFQGKRIEQLRFREETPEETGHSISKSYYEHYTKGIQFKLTEAYQDSMLALKRLQEAVVKETGKELKDNENAYIAENQLSSKGHYENEFYFDKFFKPLMKSITDLMKGAHINREEVNRYMIAKHGIERNIVFAFRNSLEEMEKAEEKKNAWSLFNAARKKLREEHPEDFYGELEKKANEISPPFPQYRQDYSGLEALTGDEENYEEIAREMVKETEDKYPTNDLWEKTNAATKETLRKSYYSGLMSKGDYVRVRDMFDYYIPLRGWKDDVASDVYEYMPGEKSAFNAPLKPAKGRKSLADDPIASIGNMAESAVLQGNRNLMKQKFLNMVLHHPTDLATIKEMWYENRGTKENPRWEASIPDIPDDATPDEISEILENHEDEMKSKENKGLARTERSGLNIPLRISKMEKNQHVVIVKRNGKEYTLFINGNPRASQAINGLTNPDSYKHRILDMMSKAKRQMAANFTARNPAFIAKNLSRDLIFSGAAVFIKEDNKYNSKWIKNTSMMPGKIFKLLYRYKNDLLKDSPMENYFKEFIQNGGETGYTNLHTTDEFKKLIDREILKADGKVDIGKIIGLKSGTVTMPSKMSIVPAFQKIVAWSEFGNRCAEDVSRFSTYMTSRQMGRNVQQSINDAKEISVNFNKKGAGGYGASTFKAFYMFFNAGVQALNNFARLAKKNPVRFGGVTALFTAAGVVLPMMNQVLINALGGDGDKDAYNNLPEWIRQNNLVFYMGNSKFFTIPISVELRAFYGMGEIFHEMASGNYQHEDPILDIMGKFTDLLPLNPMGGSGDSFLNLSPSALVPFVQLLANKDYFGKPIYKDNDWNKLDPEYTKAYSGTSSALVNSSEFFNTLFGGDKYTKSWFDKLNLVPIGGGVKPNNPAQTESLFEGYFGGLGKTINQTAKLIQMAWDPDMRQWSNAPIINGFVASGKDEKNAFGKVNEEYYDYLNEEKETGNSLKGYEKDSNSGLFDLAEKQTELYNSPQYARYQIWKNYEKQIKEESDEVKNAESEDEKKSAKLTLNLTKAQLVQELKSTEK